MKTQNFVEQVAFGKVMRWVGRNCMPKVKLALIEQAKNKVDGAVDG